MKLGDLVRWANVKKHDYLSNDNRLGILLREIEIYDRWILAEVLDAQGKKMTVMLHKETNPL
jgi:hypothetical protein